MRADEIMTSDPVVIDSRVSLARAWEVLQELKVRHLPVVNPAGALIGMLSDRDFGRLRGPLVNDSAASPLFHLEEPVAKFMSAGPIAVAPHADLARVVALMIEHRIGALPVVAEDGDVVGIISYLDLLRLVPAGAKPS